MEKFLLKTGIYSFTISFLLLFVVIPREKYTTDLNGMSSIEGTSYPDFFFNLARYSIIISIIAVVVMYFVKFKKEKKD
ncbi:hypothetical protein DVB69_09470 [Sporosarcina sp. BI001-red]|uniref:hypothetical protein n=1 Tax=Sporosarcina sp. BI001-red TaxID=2282866 RepID=UPI000E21E73F|nr:hypothetical protein [Sporosarcina sp. BI001-red]REB07078.1 hypothetical protein DVB69_09470 [Sporosarcina sp. BI001-red]